MNDDKTAEAQSGIEENGASKQRLVAGYCTMSLEEAIKKMKVVWEKEKRNAAPATAITGHWGYGAKSSGGFQALASLKRYGLIEEVPGSSQRSLKVSSMALGLLKSEGTDQAEYRKQLIFMALLPSLHEALWKKYGSELPSDKTIESFLVFDRHLSEEVARMVIRVYKETISFAKMTDADTIEETQTETAKTENKPEKPIKKDSERDQQATHMDTVITPSELPIPIAGKVARVPFPMTEEDFDLFIGTLNLWKKKLVRALNPIAPVVQLPADAVWTNADNDKPVKIVAVMGERNGELYYKSEDGTGIPASQLKF